MNDGAHTPSCRQVIDLLTEYLEGDLTPDERRLFEDHMAACPPCEAFLNTYRRSGQLARQAFCEADIPEAMKRRVRAFLKDRLGLD